MKIKISQEHINNGVRYNFKKDPLTLALEEMTGYAWLVDPQISFMCHPIGLGQYSLHHRIKFNKAINDFVCDFHNGLSVQPTEIEVDYIPVVPFVKKT